MTFNEFVVINCFQSLKIQARESIMLETVFSTTHTWLLLVVSIAFAINVIFFALVLKSDWEIVVILFLLFLYALGKYIQMAMIGPGIVRWYLSDIGFIGITGWIFFYGHPSSAKIRSAARTLATMLVVVAVCIEWVVMNFQPKQIPIPTTTPMARGDIIDVMIFIISYGLVMLLIESLERKYT